MLMDQACIWLAERDVQAVRTGFSFALHDMPFTIDSYDALPPSTLRQNPACYHGLIKQAGFEVERGFSDYRVRVAPERVERWQVALDLARQGGLEILPLSDIPSPRRVRDFTSTWNDSFEEHWGFAPSLEEEWAQVFEEPAAASVLATSAIAYRDREPVGLLFTAAEDAGRAVLASGRPLDPNERLDPVAIGVREHERGGGVATALAAAVFLARVRRGQQWLGCILALDGNRAGRRLAERLGAEIGTSHLSYRRDLGWTPAGVTEPRSSWNG